MIKQMVLVAFVVTAAVIVHDAQHKPRHYKPAVVDVCPVGLCNPRLCTICQ